MKKYIVLCAQFVGDPERGYEILYNWEEEFYNNRETAVRRGLKIRESDDFNIGVIENGQLISLDWMDEIVSSDPSELADISEKIGLRK